GRIRMSTKLELWTNMGGGQTANVLATADWAAKIEADGWDGGTVVDSECIAPDPYVVLTACALRTKRLKLGTGVSNPATRHGRGRNGGMASCRIADAGAQL